MGKRTRYLVVEIDENGVKYVPVYGLRMIAEAESVVGDMRRRRPQSHFDIESCVWIEGSPALGQVVRRFRPLAEESSAR